jgi:hypothetical protein
MPVNIVMAKVQFPAGARDFSFLYSVQSSSGPHMASYTMGTVDKRSGGMKLTTHLHLVLR